MRQKRRRAREAFIVARIHSEPQLGDVEGQLVPAINESDENEILVTERFVCGHTDRGKGCCTQIDPNFSPAATTTADTRPSSSTRTV